MSIIAHHYVWSLNRVRIIVIMKVRIIVITKGENNRNR